MPSIKLNKKRVLELLGKKISDEELIEKIPYLGTDLEEVNEKEIVVEIFPNRPDMLSEEGFARALSSFLEINKGLKKYEAKKSNYKVIIDKEVSGVRPYTACAVIKNLKLDEEKIQNLINIQEKLHVTYGRNRKRCAIGIYPFEKIKFPIKYTAKEPNKIKFIPLEKNIEMSAEEILKNHDKGKEYSHLLKDKQKYPVFIDSNGEIMSMPPIINSEKTGKITTNTKDVFIECSGHEFNVVSKALNIIVSAMSDMGGEIYEVKLEYPNNIIITPEIKNEEIEVEKYYIEKYIGIKLKEEEIINCLSKMGFEANVNKTRIKVKIPFYRVDILHPIDIVEDVAIGYGFDNIKIDEKRSYSTGKELFKQKIYSKLRDILIGHGFLETISYSLVSSKKQENILDKKNILLIKNSVSEEYNSLRNNIFVTLMDVVEYNKMHNYPQQYFEIGRVFKKNNELNNKNNNEFENLVEKDSLGVIVCGEKLGYTYIKQILENIFNSFEIKYELEKFESKIFIKGRCGKIILNNIESGFIGEISPELISERGLIVPISYLELELDVLEKIIEEIA